VADLQTAAEGLGRAADLLEATGTALQDAKLSMLAALVMAAATILWAFANAQWSLGGSLSEIPIAQLLARNSIRSAWSILVGRVEAALSAAIARTVGAQNLAEISTKALVGGLAKSLLINDVLPATGIGVLQQLAIQGFLALEGHPESADALGAQEAQAAWSMAVMGILGAVTGPSRWSGGR
jgi:hypothetical protein